MSRSTGGEAMIESSRTPVSASCRVRGIGVAVPVRQRPRRNRQPRRLSRRHRLRQRARPLHLLAFPTRLPAHRPSVVRSPPPWARPPRPELPTRLRQLRATPSPPERPNGHTLLGRTEGTTRRVPTESGRPRSRHPPLSTTAWAPRRSPSRLAKAPGATMIPTRPCPPPASIDGVCAAFPRPWVVILPRACVTPSRGCR